MKFKRITANPNQMGGMPCIGMKSRWQRLWGWWRME